MNRISKLLFVFGTGLGLALVMAKANAIPLPEDCPAYLQQCSDGNQNACRTFFRYCSFY